MATHSVRDSWGLGHEYRRQHRRRRGIALLYGLVLLTIIAIVASFAVDYGAALVVKSQLQRAADATAHDYIVLYNQNGKGYANTNGPTSYSSQANPVQLSNGAQPKYTVKWGWWDAATDTFSNSNNGGPIAVKVTASCTKANNNGVPLLFGRLLGMNSIDIHATSIAHTVSTTMTNMSIDAESDIYFAGMPSSTTSTYGDEAIDNGSTQVTAIPVHAGDILTFTNTAGTSSVIPGSMPYVGAEGVTSGANGTATHHGVSWNGSGSAYSENGIADAVIPESSLVGLFLDGNQPDTTAAPATVDWTDPTIKDKTTYSNLKLKAPFYIGDGKTSGGTVQQFTVPAGATRLYLGLWDGLQFNNNDGSISVTINSTTKSVRMVQ